jgi:hypothetical protein
MLAPLLLGTGMLLRSIKANAAYIIPRVGLLFVMLWMCWFVHSVMQRTLLFMQQQVRGREGRVSVSDCAPRARQRRSAGRQRPMLAHAWIRAGSVS